jgi:thiol-disulfide isomerase/thioredoxin
MWSELLISLVIVGLFIGIYYAVTGIPPGARIIQQTPPLASNGVDDTQAKFLFFYTTWCPHCKNAQQPVASLKELIKNRHLTYGGKEIIFEDVNAEADKGKAALYKINAYPTFKLETSDKVYEMIGPPSVSSFQAFLTSALGQEKNI